MNQANLIATQPPLHPSSFDKLNPARLIISFCVTKATTKEMIKSRTIATGSQLSTERNLFPTTPLAFSTAVFLIPVGREMEYVLFNSQKGLLPIAESARLIAVAFGRSSTFPDQEFVQKELLSVVQIMLRQGIFLSSYHQTKFADKNSIPAMGLGLKMF
jgi:hypothetical protein